MQLIISSIIILFLFSTIALIFYTRIQNDGKTKNFTEHGDDFQDYNQKLIQRNYEGERREWNYEQEKKEYDYKHEKKEEETVGDIILPQIPTPQIQSRPIIPLLATVEHVLEKTIISFEYDESADICFDRQDITIRNNLFTELKFESNSSVYIKSFQVLFDYKNMNGLIESVHLLCDSKLITICLINTALLHRQMFDGVAKTLIKIKKLYMKNFIIILDENKNPFDIAGMYEKIYKIDNIDSTSISIDWRLNDIVDLKSILHKLLVNSSHQFQRCTDAIIKNDLVDVNLKLKENVKIITDENTFGFYDSETNVLVLKNNQQNKFFTKLRNLLFV